MERQIFFPFRWRKFLIFYLFWQVPLQVLRVEPADPLGAALADILEEAGTLVMVSQLTQQRLRLDLRHQSHVHRGQQDHESPWQLVWQDVKTLPYVSFIVPWLHLDSPANADVLEECGAGVGTQVIVTNQNADLSSQWLHSVCKILDSPFSTCTSSPAVTRHPALQSCRVSQVGSGWKASKIPTETLQLQLGGNGWKIDPFIPQTAVSLIFYIRTMQ